MTSHPAASDEVPNATKPTVAERPVADRAGGSHDPLSGAVERQAHDHPIGSTHGKDPLHDHDHRDAGARPAARALAACKERATDRPGRARHRLTWRRSTTSQTGSSGSRRASAGYGRSPAIPPNPLVPELAADHQRGRDQLRLSDPASNEHPKHRSLTCRRLRCEESRARLASAAAIGGAARAGARRRAPGQDVRRSADG